ncbi:MAG: DUF4350 domain-containing protein [Armatimonadota bacterium]
MFLSVAAWGMLNHSCLGERGPWGWVLGASVCVAGWCFARAGSPPLPSAWALVAVPCGALAIPLSGAFRVTGLLLAGAFILVGLSAKHKALTAFARGFLFAAAVMALSAALHLPYLRLAPRLYWWSPLAPAAGWLARLLGWNVTMGDARLYLARDTSLMDFTAEPEAFFYYPIPIFLVLGLAVAGMSGMRRAAEFTALAGIYGTVRYTMLTAFAAEGYAVSVYWRQDLLLATFLPLPLMLARLVPFRLPRLPQTAKRASASWLLPASACFAGAVLLVCSAWLNRWTDLGVRKQGRILIDERHSAWTPTWPPPNTVQYGMLSTYNYAGMGELLARYYDVTVNFDRKLDGPLLSQYDVLLIKLPSSAFTTEEVDAIRRFVCAGGGLWLIGDHTNVFGSAVYLNQVCRQFGIRFLTDCTWDLPTRRMNVWANDSPLPAHPILGRMKEFEFENGDTIDLPLFSDDFMVIRDVFMQEADYSTEVFFPVREQGERNARIGTRALFGGVRYGLGRVAAFTDSTSFSTFAMTAEGRHDMVLCTAEWLNRRNVPLWPARLATWLGAALTIAGALSLAKCGTTAAVFGLAVLMFGTAGFAAAAKWTRADLLPPEKPGGCVPYLYLLRQDGGALYDNLDPARWGNERDPERTRRYSTFAINAQRLGIVPLPADEVPRPSPGDALMIAKPGRPFTDEELAAIERFVATGGSLLVLVDNSSDASDHTQAVASLFGIAYGPRASQQTALYNAEGRYVVTAGRPRTLSGGSAILLADAPGSATQSVVMAEAVRGSGRVIVFGDGVMFANRTMGHHFEVPDRNLKRVYDLEYLILARLFGQNVIRRRPTATVLGRPTAPLFKPSATVDWRKPELRLPNLTPVRPETKRRLGE